MEYNFYKNSETKTILLRKSKYIKPMTISKKGLNLHERMVAQEEKQNKESQEKRRPLYLWRFLIRCSIMGSGVGHISVKNDFLAIQRDRAADHGCILRSTRLYPHKKRQQSPVAF